MTQSPGKERKAAIAFILVTLFIDILGIGIIVPVLPELVKELVEVDGSGLIPEGVQEAVTSRTGGAGENLSAAENFARAGKYVGVISATYALMQFLFAPIMGANFTTANAYIADVSTDDTRARNFGFVGMMFGLGFTIGPALGGFLGDYSLRLPFFVAAGLALVNWLYGYFVLPESLPLEKRSAFSLRNANPFGTLRRIRMYPMVAGLAAVFACKSLAQRGLENVWVLYTGFRYEWDAGMNGWALGLVGIMAVVVQGGLVRPTVRRLGERRTVIVGTLVGAFSFLGYGLANQSWMIPGIIVFGAFAGVSGPAIQSLVTSRVDETEQGKIQGALTSLTSLTNIIAPILFNTFLFSYFISDDAPFLLPGAPFFVGFLLLLISIGIAVRVFRKFPETATD